MSSVRGSSATPHLARQTRSRPSRANTPAVNEPLPALQAAQSFAYGAPGKAHLRKQVITTAAEVDEAFDSQPRADTPHMPPPPRPARPEKAQELSITDPHEPRRGFKPQTAPSSTVLSQSTGIQGSALYLNRPNIDLEAPISAPPRARTRVVPTPGTWKDAKLAFLILFSAVGLFGWMLTGTMALISLRVPSFLAGTQERILSGMRFLSLRPPHEWEYRWNQFLHDVDFNYTMPNFSYPEAQVAINHYLKVHLDNNTEEVRALQDRTTALESRTDLHQAMIGELQKYLPMSVELNRTVEKIAGMGHLVRNLEASVREINYFSPAQRALVDPHYTSRTLGRPATWSEWLIWATGLSALQIPQTNGNPPIAALMQWKEFGECWCSVPSADEKGQAQLGIRLGHTVYPEKLILEHISAGGTLDIAGAPRELEFWAQLESPQEAQKVKDLLAQRVHISQSYECGAPPKGQQNWVCLGTGHYDIHQKFYAQEFELHGNWEGIPVTTSRMVVRVVSNWGAEDHTCIYRVRMTGSQAAQLVDVDEEL
ncbi:Hypothetical predicted protein [Lecanosticta acicola]|uniref:SUN domain-containing protein n=1 Tax=Lecanosticta acicola TaxID=111012 RepID=A0AAI8YXT5_9PEZI|nr:Hypothetical predicted protein [Lecanosticta acicola]